MPCFCTSETTKGKENIHLKPSILTSPNNRLSSWLSPKPLIFFTDQIKNKQTKQMPLHYADVYRNLSENLSYAAYHLTSTVGLFTIIIYPK